MLITSSILYIFLCLQNLLHFASAAAGSPKCAKKCRLQEHPMCQYNQNKETAKPFQRQEWEDLETWHYTMRYRTEIDAAAAAASAKADDSGDANQPDLQPNHTRANNEHPRAANVTRMLWDDRVAETAQRWAEQCRYKTGKPTHNECRLFGSYNVVGQNLYSKKEGTIKDAQTSWYPANSNPFRRDTFEKSSNTTDLSTPVAQITLARADKFGCGKAECPVGSATEVLIVCNYAKRSDSCRECDCNYPPSTFSPCCARGMSIQHKVWLLLLVATLFLLIVN